MSKYIGATVVNLSVDTVDVTGDITATDSTPELILLNDTHEDIEGGREGKVTFKGEQSGGEVTVLAQIQSGHDGTSDDEKGDLIFKTNDGSDGASPTERMRIDSAGTVTITNASNDSQLILESTDADASSGPVLELFRNSASPADNDLGGAIEFYAENDADEKIRYQLIQAYMPDVSDGSEDGAFQQYIMKDGTAIQRMEHSPTETVFNQDSADVNFRVESNGNANMLIVDGGEDMVFIGKNATHEFDAYGTEIMMQLESSGTAPYAGFGMVQNSNDADGAPLIFGKSRGTSAAATTIVQEGDTLGRIEFQGMDGSDLETAASIFGQVDGTPGSNDMPGRLVFNTTADGAHSATERMRIDRNGALLVGTTSNIIRNDGFRVMPDGSSGGTLVECFNDDGGIALDVGRGGSNGECQRFFRGSSQVGNISVTTTSTAFNTSSDYRLKENVTNITDGITRVKQLSPKRFNFIVDADTTVDGFLAHEAQTVVPEAITGTKDEVEVWEDSDELPDGVSVGDNKLDDDGKTIPVMQSIDQAKLVPLLTAALQEAIAKIETLETKVAALEAE